MNNREEYKVSIIVPVYNVEKYISKCVKSLIMQNYNNIEIILVDDGSTDSSGILIDEMGLQDDRIKIVHQNNGGVSLARNKGMDIASGEYVVFVDGDDWVDSNYVSYFLSLIIKKECYIAMNINNYTAVSNKSKEKEYCINAEKAIEKIYLGDIFVAVWNKMYNLSFLRKNNIRFDESIWYGEGMLFNIECLQFVERVAIGEKSVYHQVSNPDSAMRKFNLESNKCGIRSLDIQKEHWKKTNKEIVKSWEFHRYAFNWTIMGGVSRSGQEQEYRDEYDKCAIALRKGVYKALRVKISLKQKLMYLCIAMCPYLMAKREKRKVRY